MDLPFPTDVRDFDADERISFSKLDNKFIAVHDDGTEFEFDAELKRWVPADDEPADDDAHDYGGAQPLAYPADDDAASKKRKNGAEDATMVSFPPVQGRDSHLLALEMPTANAANLKPENSRPSRPSKRQKPPPQPKQNTAVYVTGLPLDATVDEVNDLFSRKGGVIAEEIDSHAPRIKLYTDSEGKFKGDALVVFFKPQSVEMAIMLLDDTDFRITPSGTGEGRMRIQAADASYKKVQHDQEAGAEGGGNRPAGQQADRRPQRSDRDRQRIIKKTQKLDAKLADWDDDEPYPAPGESTSSRWDKVVILSHMFTLQELEEDPAALLDIKEDIRDECSKLGTVTNIVLFDEEPEGIVSVKFQDAASAEACIKVMHGRSFDGRTVEAFLATGREKFKRSKKEQPGEDDSD